MTRHKINIALTVVISLGFAVLGYFVFSQSYLRLWESVKDLWISIRFYFYELFHIGTPVKATVTEYSEMLKLETGLPQDWNGFTDKFVLYIKELFNPNVFQAYWAGKDFVTVCKVLIVTMPLLLILFFAIKAIYRQSNTKHNKDTLPLKAYKKFVAVCVQPPIRFARQYVAFVRHYSPIWIVWLVMWLLYLNIASIVVEFLAFYFYFSSAFDVAGIYTQVVKLVVDLQVAVNTIPVVLWIIFAWLLLDRWRKGLARNRLHRYEGRNCGLITDLPIVSMSCGSMGKKKTTVITDMALSQEVMFRQEAFRRLQKQDMKFPNFPWISFEMELRHCMEHHVVYNLATIKQWVRLKEDRFNRHGNTNLQLYGYDINRYGYTFNDALKVETLWDVLETYALLYFIYVIESSLLVSNYSIRTDNVLQDNGNFPMWYSDFFPETVSCESRHAHILDFDLLRLGKKVLDDSLKGSMEFGVLVITEIGKERGNNLELKEVKKVSDETNQKNDMFNQYLKMCRHAATVDNYPFVKVFTDEQRPESWGADARDLCDILTIVNSGEEKLALPFYTITDMLCEWAFNGFIRLYYDFRFRRGDNTLLVHLLKNITAWLWRRNIRIYNKYGYRQVNIEKERGTMDGKLEKKKYYLMNKKIYSRRFSTDCFSDYFSDIAKDTQVGIEDLREYATEKATVEELKLQNSYFINSLYH